MGELETFGKGASPVEALRRVNRAERLPGMVGGYPPPEAAPPTQEEAQAEPAPSQTDLEKIAARIDKRAKEELERRGLARRDATQCVLNAIARREAPLSTATPNDGDALFLIADILVRIQGQEPTAIESNTEELARKQFS